MNETDKKLSHYHKKLGKIQVLIQKLDDCKAHRQILVGCEDRKLAAFIHHKTHLAYLENPIPIPERLANEIRKIMIEELEKEVKILHNELDELF